MMRWIFTFFLMAGLWTLNAQVSIRPKLGLSMARFNTSVEGVDLVPRVDKLYGADVLVGNRWFLQSGATVEGLNWIVDSDDKTIGPETDAITHLTLPFLLGFRVSSFERKSYFNLRFATGPSASILVDSDSSTVFSGADFNRTILNWQSVLGIDLFFLFFDLDYQRGLTPTITSQNRKIGMSTWYVNGGVRWDI